MDSNENKRVIVDPDVAPDTELHPLSLAVLTHLARVCDDSKRTKKEHEF